MLLISLQMAYGQEQKTNWSALEHIPLATGELIIPHDYRPQEGQINLVFHMHGSAQAAAKAFAKAELDAVMISVHLGSFSSPYQRYFSNPNHFHERLDESLEILSQRFPESPLQWKHICVVAFSGGYGGAREFMHVDEIYSQIDSLVLLDCPHTSYTDDRNVNPAQMEGFVRFAQEAQAGRKTFLMTHSEIIPGTYASTTECADYLIHAVEGNRQLWSGTNSMGMEQASKYEAGTLHILGYKGDTAADHMKHFHGMHIFLEMIPALTQDGTVR